MARTWFGKFCFCCCLPLLPELACSIHATWPKPIPCTADVLPLVAIHMLYAPLFFPKGSPIDSFVWTEREGDAVVLAHNALLIDCTAPGRERIGEKKGPWGRYISYVTSNITCFTSVTSCTMWCKKNLRFFLFSTFLISTNLGQTNAQPICRDKSSYPT